MAQRAETERPEPSTPPLVIFASPERAATVREYTDANWLHGVTRGKPAGAWLEADAGTLSPGDTVAVPRGDGTFEERRLLYAWGPSGAQTFFEGEPLNPATQGAGTAVRLRTAGEVLERQPIQIFGAGYVGRPVEEGGFWDAVAGAIGDAAGAVGNVAEAAANGAKAAVSEAAKSPWAQVLAAAATGGGSLLVQAGYEAATGKDGAILGTVKDIAKDPIGVLSKLPGDVLLASGLPGLVLDAARVAGGALAGAAGENSALGKAADRVRDAAQVAQQAARDNPVASLETIAAVVLAVTGVGGPVAAALAKDAVERVAGGGDSQAPHEATPAPQAPVEGERLHLMRLDAPEAAPAGVPAWKWAAVGLAVLGGGGLVTWALLGADS